MPDILLSPSTVQESIPMEQLAVATDIGIPEDAESSFKNDSIPDDDMLNAVLDAMCIFNEQQ